MEGGAIFFFLGGGRGLGDWLKNVFYVMLTAVNKDRHSARSKTFKKVFS
jgi:hypothetical protein